MFRAHDWIIDRRSGRLVQNNRPADPGGDRRRLEQRQAEDRRLREREQLLLERLAEDRANE